ncbi:MAG: methionyl-tRNA formyltransferase [Nannocystaceae bacterium]
MSAVRQHVDSEHDETMTLRAAFFGSPAFAVPSLHATAAACRLVVAVCQPDRPAGRGRTLSAPPVKQAAERIGVPVLQPTKVRDGSLVRALAPYQLDVAVVVAYGRILPPELLVLPREGCINVHGSLLPRWRGAAPIQRAILAGDTQTGVCIMQMDEGCDTGAVYSQHRTEIGEHETSGELAERLAQLAAAALEAFLRNFDSRGRPVAQVSTGVTMAAKLEKVEGVVDFTRASSEVADHIQGMDPWPGALCWLQGRRLKLFGGCAAASLASSVDPAGSVPGDEPGSVLAIDEHGLRVRCGSGTIVRIGEVQPEGRKRMSAKVFAHGVRLEMGAMLRSRVGGA